MLQRHFVLDAPLVGPFPEALREAMFGMGCFWGAERKFWQADGVFSTAVGYAAGRNDAPTYKQVCSGRTGHAEVVRVVFDPARTTYEALLRIFWESHDPTQGDRQGNDVGSQYRSGVYTYGEAQQAKAELSRDDYGTALRAAGHRAAITTEIIAAPTFWIAEPYHQQYLAKNPLGYCGLGGTGVSCPTGVEDGAR